MKRNIYCKLINFLCSVGGVMGWITDWIVLDNRQILISKDLKSFEIKKISKEKKKEIKYLYRMVLFKGRYKDKKMMKMLAKKYKYE